MSMLEELFGLDEAEEAEALERVIEGGSDLDEPAGNPDDEAIEDKRTVDPAQPKSVRVVKNPQVVLNAARLTGPRGLQALPQHFKDFKFKGKGHEKEDLDMVLKKLEHWAHRLYPKFQFDDCIKKIETLGNKRPVLVTLRKIRSDQIFSDEIVDQRDSSDDEAPRQQEEDEFDKLLQQQIELAREHDTPRSTAMRTPSFPPKATSSPSISEEQKLRILKNRQMAEERRRKKNQSDGVVDLTGFNQPISSSQTNIVDLTNLGIGEDISTKDNEIGKNKENVIQNGSDYEKIDITNDKVVEDELDDKENHFAANLRSSSESENNEQDIKISEVVNRNEMNKKVIKNITENKQTAEQKDLAKTAMNDPITETNVQMNKPKGKTYNPIIENRYTEANVVNVSKEISNNCNSDEDCEVSDVNICVTADVHRASLTQGNENVVEMEKACQEKSVTDIMDVIENMEHETENYMEINSESLLNGELQKDVELSEFEEDWDLK